MSVVKVTLKDLKDRAKLLQIKGYSTMKKEQLETAISKALLTVEDENMIEPGTIDTTDQDIGRIYVPDFISLSKLNIDAKTYGNLTEDQRDSIKNGYFVMYNSEIYQIIIDEPNNNKYLFRVFQNEKKDKLVAFTFIPNGNVGSAMLYNTDISTINKISDGQYENNFNLDEHENILTKIVNGNQLVFKHPLYDSFTLNNDRSIQLKLHLFSPGFHSSYAVYKNKKYFAVKNNCLAARYRLCKVYKCIEKNCDEYTILYHDETSSKIFWIPAQLTGVDNIENTDHNICISLQGAITSEGAPFETSR